MGAYFAMRIMKGMLKYEDVVKKYPQFKDDIDFILRSEGKDYLITVPSEKEEEIVEEEIMA